jgi:hypothetical protein
MMTTTIEGSFTNTYSCCCCCCCLFDRLAMLGVVLGLYVEMMTGTGLLEQTAQHPLRVLFIGLLIAFASYAPVVK